MSKNKPKQRKADGQCNKLASSAELSRLSTDDLSQFITLSVQLCVERDACNSTQLNRELRTQVSDTSKSAS